MSLELTDRLFFSLVDVFAMFDSSFLVGGIFQFLMRIANMKVADFQQSYFNLLESWKQSMHMTN